MPVKTNNIPEKVARYTCAFGAFAMAGLDYVAGNPVATVAEIIAGLILLSFGAD